MLPIFHPLIKILTDVSQGILGFMITLKYLHIVALIVWMIYFRTKITLLTASGCFCVSTQLPGLKYIIQMNFCYEFVVLLSLNLLTYVTLYESLLRDVIDGFCYVPWWACQTSRPWTRVSCACYEGEGLLLFIDN